MSEDYWAAGSKDELGPELEARVSATYNHVTSTGLYDLRRRSYYAYYGLDESGSYHKSSAVAFGGKQGELTLFKVNHFRNILTHMLNYATQNRPALEARAINSDYKSLAQATLANGVLDYYLHAKGVEDAFVRTCEYGVFQAEGFLSVTWDTTLGKAYGVDPETQQAVYEGDVRVEALSPLDVIKDPFRPFEQADWLMTRRFVNRYDLIARYPELKDELLSAERREWNGSDTPVIGFQRVQSDDCAEFTFYHRRTPSMPDGRCTIFTSAKAILYDGPLPYDEIPVYRIAPAELLGTSYGYTVAFDLLALQQGIDAVRSAELSAVTAFGVQNIIVEDGGNIGLEQLTGGLNLIKIPKGAAPPQALRLLDIPSELSKLAPELRSEIELLSGINSTSRGTPEANLKSGSALAFMESRTLQFMGGLQRSYTKLLECSGTAILKLLKQFATTPRMVEIVGKDQRFMTKQFSGADLDKIQRVIVDVGNPLMRVMSGRLQVADTFLERNMIKSPEEYFQLLRTGRLERMYEGETTELLNIKAENEALSMGPPSEPSGGVDPMTGQPEMTVQGVNALVTDNHPLHIEEHRAVLSNPESRQSPEVVRAVGDHIAEHIRQWKNAPPELLAAIKIAPPPMAMGPMPGGPPGPAPMPANDNGGAQPMSDAAQQANVGPANLPQMPKDPMTGERVASPGANAA